MKNIQIIDGAVNSVYDIFAATDEEFALIFREGTDVAFIDEVYSGGSRAMLDSSFKNIWPRRLAKKDAMGIHGILFYELEKRSLTIQRVAMRKPQIRTDRDSASIVQTCGSTAAIK